MAVHEVSGRTTLVTATAGAPLCAFRAPTNQRARVREFHIFGVTGPTTSGAVGLCRSTALGTGTLTSTAPVPRDPADAASNAQLVTNWGTAGPAIGGVGTVFRRFASPASVGNGVMWAFDGDGLIVPLGSAANGELVLVNLQATAPGTYEVTVVFED